MNIYTEKTWCVNHTVFCYCDCYFPLTIQTTQNSYNNSFHLLQPIQPPTNHCHGCSLYEHWWCTLAQLQSCIEHIASNDDMMGSLTHRESKSFSEHSFVRKLILFLHCCSFDLCCDFMVLNEQLTLSALYPLWICCIYLCFRLHLCDFVIYQLILRHFSIHVSPLKPQFHTFPRFCSQTSNQTILSLQ